MHELFVFEHEPFGMRVSVDGIVVLRVYRKDEFVLELYDDRIEDLKDHPRYRTIVRTLDILYNRLESKFRARNQINRIIDHRTVAVTDELIEASERVKELCRIMQDTTVKKSLRRNAVFELNGWLKQLTTSSSAQPFTSLYSDSKPNVDLLDYNLYDVIYFTNVLYDYCHRVDE